MGYLAYITTPLQKYAPLSWGLAAVVSLLLLALGYWLFAIARLRRSDARVRETLASPPITVNPLRTAFEDERVRVSDFYYLPHEYHDGKTFARCHVVGPGAIAIVGCPLLDCSFHACDIIAVKESTAVRTAAGFKHTTFNGVTFVSVTIFVSVRDAEALVAKIKTRDTPFLPIIGYNA